MVLLKRSTDNTGELNAGHDSPKFAAVRRGSAISYGGQRAAPVVVPVPPPRIPSGLVAKKDHLPRRRNGRPGLEAQTQEAPSEFLLREEASPAPAPAPDNSSATTAAVGAAGDPLKVGAADNDVPEKLVPSKSLYRVPTSHARVSAISLRLRETDTGRLRRMDVVANLRRPQTSMSSVSARSDPSDLLQKSKLRARKTSARSALSEEEGPDQRHKNAESAPEHLVRRERITSSSSTHSSAAAAFFARASQKLHQLPGSPHRRRMGPSAGAPAAGSLGVMASTGTGIGTPEEDPVGRSGFSSVVRHSPPPVPPSLLRRLGAREVSGLGKVKVTLRISGFSAKEHQANSISMDTSAPNSPAHSANSTQASPLPSCVSASPDTSTKPPQPSYLFVDERRKQVTLHDPGLAGVLGGASDAPEDRRVSVSAPKMFAFDAIYTDDDAQSEVCSGALSDLLQAVLSGNDGVLFCFGQSRADSARTMLGAPRTSALGSAPCAIAWLFRCVAELRARGGARFSVRVSAVEAGSGKRPLRDLLAAHANDSDQSPGVYLRDDPVLGTQLQNHCELRAPTAEKAAYYLDCALAARAQDSAQDGPADSHLFFTLHVYQYNVAGKGGVAGGRSRLHLVDLGAPERSRGASALQLSGLGHVLLAIFNGQKHLPHREHKVTQLLKECLSPITCHAAMVVHVAPNVQTYPETLSIVQLASRIHRLRRRKIKFPSVNSACGPSEDLARMQTDLEPSSSEQSADTVIYVGPADDATDGEHPPVYIPGLGDGDQRGAMARALRGSSAEHKPGSKTGTPTHTPKDTTKTRLKSSAQQCSPKSSPVRTASAKSSPAKIPLKVSGGSEECWVDGPRVSKSKVVEARTLILKDGHAKRETWVDGPLHATNGGEALGNGPASGSYGYMDSHKKSMIKRWVENQTIHIKHMGMNMEDESRLDDAAPEDAILDPKLISVDRHGRHYNGRCKGRHASGFKYSTRQNGGRVAAESRRHGAPPTAIAHGPDVAVGLGAKDDRPANLPLVLSTNMTADLSSSGGVEHPEEAGLNRNCDTASAEPQQAGPEMYGDLMDDKDLLVDLSHVGDEVEIMEVVDSADPVPMQDCCLQVTEEDIALCMGVLENPLPEVDQEDPEEHPLRILSQENLTVVSTFADSLSVMSDLEPSVPFRSRFATFQHMNRPTSRPCSLMSDCCRGHVRHSSEEAGPQQLALLHDMYISKLAATSRRIFDQSVGQTSRCTSLSLSDMLHGLGSNASDVGDPDVDDGLVPDGLADVGSIYSEPAYQPCAMQSVPPGKGAPDNANLCDNCHRSFGGTWHCSDWPCVSARNGWNRASNGAVPLSARASLHRYYGNLSSLRHPDGASNPDLKEVAVPSTTFPEGAAPEVAAVGLVSTRTTCEEIERKIDAKLRAASISNVSGFAEPVPPPAPAPTDNVDLVDSDEDSVPDLPPPLPSPPSSRLHHRLLSLSDNSVSPRSNTPVSGDGLPIVGSSSGPGSGTGSAALGSSSGYESLGSAPASCSGRDSGKEDTTGGLYCRDDVARLERGWASCRHSHERASSQNIVSKTKISGQPWSYEHSPTTGCLPDTWCWCWCGPWTPWGPSTGDKCDKATPTPVSGSGSSEAPRVASETPGTGTGASGELAR